MHTQRSLCEVMEILNNCILVFLLLFMLLYFLLILPAFIDVMCMGWEGLNEIMCCGSMGLRSA